MDGKRYRIQGANTLSLPAEDAEKLLALGDGDMDMAWYRALAERCGCRAVLETKTVAALRKSVEYLRVRGWI